MRFSSPPLRFANSKTPAVLELPLRPAKHFLRDLGHSLDHLFSVRPSFARSVCHMTVDDDSVPVQLTETRAERFAVSPDGLQPLLHTLLADD